MSSNSVHKNAAHPTASIQPKPNMKRVHALEILSQAHNFARALESFLKEEDDRMKVSCAGWCVDVVSERVELLSILRTSDAAAESPEFVRAMQLLRGGTWDKIEKTVLHLLFVQHVAEKRKSLCKKVFSLSEDPLDEKNNMIGYCSASNSLIPLQMVEDEWLPVKDRAAGSVIYMVSSHMLYGMHFVLRMDEAASARRKMQEAVEMECRHRAKVLTKFLGNRLFDDDVLGRICEFLETSLRTTEPFATVLDIILA